MGVGRCPLGSGAGKGRGSECALGLAKLCGGGFGCSQIRWWRVRSAVKGLAKGRWQGYKRAAGIGVRNRKSIARGGRAPNERFSPTVCAPRHGVVDPRGTREGLSVRPLGCLAHLKGKPGGESSMPEKPECVETA